MPQVSKSRAVQGHLALATRVAAAWERGEPEALRGLLAEDVVWHVPGVGLLAGDHDGRARVLEVLRKARALTGGTLKVQSIGMAIGERHVMWFHRVTAQRNGRALDTLETVTALVRHGKIAEVWQAQQDQYAVDRFYS